MPDLADNHSPEQWQPSHAPHLLSGSTASRSRIKDCLLTAVRPRRTSSHADRELSAQGLKRLYDSDDPKGLPAQSVGKIKAILAALDSAADLSQVATMPGWKLHPLKGGRRGQYGITVTRNRRITFRLRGNTVTDVDFEDYH